MDTSIGVVGPHDLVDSVAAVCEEQPGVRVHRFDYDHESQATDLVTTHATGVDGWLFTGIVPYTIAQDALTRPATFVDYSGATLLQALVRLLREGRDVAHLSIDTLDSRQVTDTLAEAGVSTDDVRAMPYRPGATSEEFAAFHRRYAARRAATVAITCVASVHDELSGTIPVLRLAPLPQSVRMALRQLLLTSTNQIQEDAQVALGLVEIDPTARSESVASDLTRELGALGASLSHYSPTTSMIVTTRGPLHDATNGFTALPMLRRLGRAHETVRIGFGLGHSGAEAERLARRALSRARSHGPVAAVVSLRNDVDITLDADSASQDGAPEQSRAVVASRVGLSADTLDRLREVTTAAGDRALTTRDIADGLGIQLRTARRILQRLEMAGYAERSGNADSGTIGRPLTLYQLTI
ncbi:hypothetical protein CLV30_1117 [Haloactinopolyspora alba]|uniref:Uncharacterized protein n=1 Tax=Haloactinopolyspora alba TaxID=648780 RepID=A0A2P8DXW7_9ACTN|nr:hypothetical protein [Haloactinopolyspora alba]PSL02052.1 hypothetical protein CLV30_1117 [Haloactinopolyspora alba]